MGACHGEAGIVVLVETLLLLPQDGVGPLLLSGRLEILKGADGNAEDTHTHTQVQIDIYC